MAFCNPAEVEYVATSSPPSGAMVSTYFAPVRNFVSNWIGRSRFGVALILGMEESL